MFRFLASIYIVKMFENKSQINLGSIINNDYFSHSWEDIFVNRSQLLTSSQKYPLNHDEVTYIGFSTFKSSS